MHKEGKPERSGAGCNFETKPAKAGYYKPIKNQKKMETKQNDFAPQVAADAAAQAHAQEIKETRVGGLGGSDAAMVYKIGAQGMAALSNTDMKRIAVMLGKSEPSSFGGNAYTNAGHLFEDYAEANLPLTENYKREERIEGKLAVNFKTFAHADFTDRIEGQLSVIECKFVQESTSNVTKKYYAQLQWYYMLGANRVMLYHGTGIADPFEVETGETIEIERDEDAIKILLAGIKTLDKALQNGWMPTGQDKIQLSDTPEIVKQAFDKLSELKAQKVKMEAEEAEAKAVLKEYMEGFCLTGVIADGDVKRQVIWTAPKTTFRFNSDKFLKDHPEFNLPEYFKATKTGATVSFK